MSPSGSGAAAVAEIAVAAAVSLLSSLLAGGGLAVALARPRAEGEAPVRRRLATVAGLLAATALALLPLTVAEAWLSAPGQDLLGAWRRAFGPSWLLLVAAFPGALGQRRALLADRPVLGRGSRLLGWGVAALGFAFLAASSLAAAALEVPGRAGLPPLDAGVAGLALPRALGALALGGALLVAVATGASPARWRPARLAAAVLPALALLAAVGVEAARAPLLEPPPAPLAPGGAADGRALFAARCRGCHTVAGPRGVRRHLDGRSLDQIATVLHTLDRRHGHAAYPGPDAEQAALARWLAGLDGVVEPEGVEAQDFLARGRKVMEGFCLSCHVLDGPPSQNPLRPKVRGWTQDEAYQVVGRLSRLNPGMIDYDGPDADRQALAAWLALVGAEGEP